MSNHCCSTVDFIKITDWFQKEPLQSVCLFESPRSKNCCSAFLFPQMLSIYEPAPFLDVNPLLIYEPTKMGGNAGPVTSMGNFLCYERKRPWKLVNLSNWWACVWTYLCTSYGQSCDNQNLLAWWVTKFSNLWCSVSTAIINLAKGQGKLRNTNNPCKPSQFQILCYSASCACYKLRPNNHFAKGQLFKRKSKIDKLFETRTNVTL